MLRSQITCRAGAYVIICLLLFVCTANIHAQNFKIHSHNDYLRNVPFWEAYANGAASIEADLILEDGDLYVAHEKASIRPERTFENLYLAPIRTAKAQKIGRLQPLILLIDLKTEAYSTLQKLMEVLEPYQDLWQPEEEGTSPLLQLVISGNRPDKKDYRNYPDHIFFDYQSVTDTLDLPLDKIAMVSLNFRHFSQWNGKGRLVDEDRGNLLGAIRVAHCLDKPIRFWATPDSKTAWKALKELGVDYINTDDPYGATQYLSTLENRLYISPNTREVYRPLFEKDGIQAPVKNVILMIGDGNGLAQIAAAMYANHNQLSLTQLKNMGLIKTQALDDFTTDSAAAGTALATGRKVKNRSVGALPDGSPAQNLPEYLQQYHYLTGIVTTDNVTGATPGAFYAHQTERDMIKEIAADLPKSPLNLFVGGGKNDFIRYGNDEILALKEAGFTLAPSLEALKSATSGRVGYFASNHSLPKVEKGRNGFLKEATKAALGYFSDKNSPFFLMVEGAYIDSGGHQNQVSTVIEEGMDFDEAIEEALKFADKDGQTLVIITADHETGGATLPQGGLEKGQVELEFSTEDHTAIMVPIFAYGPHADAFRGVYENTEVFEKIVEIIEEYVHR